MQNDFEKLTDQQVVRDLGPDDLIAHARHILLAAAKDLTKSRHEGDRLMGQNCVSVACILQDALETFGSNHAG